LSEIRVIFSYDEQVKNQNTVRFFKINDITTPNNSVCLEFMSQHQEAHQSSPSQTWSDKAWAWIPLQAPIYKLNTEAAMFDGSSVGLGGVVCDEEGMNIRDASKQ